MSIVNYNMCNIYQTLKLASVSERGREGEREGRREGEGRGRKEGEKGEREREREGGREGGREGESRPLLVVSLLLFFPSSPLNHHSHPKHADKNRINNTAT